LGHLIGGCTGEADIYLRIGEFRDASVPPLFQREMLGTSPAGSPSLMPRPQLERLESEGEGFSHGGKMKTIWAI
jgi:hypothetical protein